MKLRRDKVPALNRIEARSMWEAAYWIGHGYRMKFDFYRNRIFMVRSA